MATSGKPKKWGKPQDELLLYLFKITASKNGVDLSIFFLSVVHLVQKI